MASGSPSSRRQISATAAALAVGQGEGGIDGARPLDEEPHRLGRPATAADGRVRPGTGQRRHAARPCSPETRRGPGW